MSRLLEELRKDPTASFELECVLPSGNTMFGIIGPMVGSNVAANITFKNNPPSDQDIAVAKAILDQQMETPAAVVHIANTQKECEEGARIARKFLGGGQG